MSALLNSPAWRPFLDPLDLHDYWWWTLLGLALGISIAYRAVRVHSFEGYWRRVAVMTIQIVGGMMLLSALVYLVVEVLV
jgi:hypothetical protein